MPVSAILGVGVHEGCGKWGYAAAPHGKGDIRDGNTQIRPPPPPELGQDPRRALGPVLGFVRWAGHRPAHWPDTFGNRMAAEAWLHAERLLIERGDWTPPAFRAAKQYARAMTFGEYAESWVEQRNVSRARAKAIQSCWPSRWPSWDRCRSTMIRSWRKSPISLARAAQPQCASAKAGTNLRPGRYSSR